MARTSKGATSSAAAQQPRDRAEATRYRTAPTHPEPSESSTVEGRVGRRRNRVDGPCQQEAVPEPLDNPYIQGTESFRKPSNTRTTT